MTQKEQIREHLKKHGEITSWEAIQMYSITRLAEIIRRIPEMKVKVTYHGSTGWARYKLVK